MNRRKFLAAVGTFSVLAAASRGVALRAAEPWRPSQRYPDPLVRILDPSFAKYRLPLAKVDKIASGMRRCEGPEWFGDGRYWLWSDIPNNRILKWEEETDTGAARTSRDAPANARAGGTRVRPARLTRDGGRGAVDTLDAGRVGPIRSEAVKEFSACLGRSRKVRGFATRLTTATAP